MKNNFKDGKKVIADLQKSPDFLAKMKFTKEEFMPALIKASASIDDATTFLSSISTVIMQKFLDAMKDKKFSELKLIESLDIKAPNYKEIKLLLELFNNHSIFDARASIEGMVSEIRVFIDDELKGRTLDSLKMNWIDEKYGKN